jgi:hypothetical protein
VQRTDRDYEDSQKQSQYKPFHDSSLLVLVAGDTAQARITTGIRWISQCQASSNLSSKMLSRIISVAMLFVYNRRHEANFHTSGWAPHSFGNRLDKLDPISMHGCNHSVAVCSYANRVLGSVKNEVSGRVVGDPGVRPWTHLLRGKVVNS